VAPPHLPVAGRRPLSLRQEFARKSLHLGAAAIPVAYSLGVPRAALEVILSVAVAIALTTEVVRRVSPWGGALFARLFGSLIRGHEERSVTGATWLALSCLALVLLLSRDAAIAALWCATAGDPVAAIAGRTWTSMRAPVHGHESRKTIVGSLACAVVSFAGSWFLAGCPPLRAALIATAATLAEALPVNIDDNVRVAVAAGAVAQLVA